MKHQIIPNTNLEVSSFCYGVMHFGAIAKGDDIFKLYELYCNAGGNFFDTAHSYACWFPDGYGVSERSLGECLKKFGNRDELVITTKGACPGMGNIYPRPDDCMTAEVIASDLSDSLERLQLDYVDAYILHRDDVRHPVGEIIEILNAEIAKGRIKYIGASNWTSERLAEANEYAADNNLQGFVVSSPQWNMFLANHQPINWDGTHDDTAHIMTDEDISWHRQANLAVMPWTPTAYGYIAGSTSSNAASFDNPVSRKRRERAIQLAEQLKCTPLQVGLAYLRAYEFPVFPILGTMNLQHLAESLAADDIVLTTRQRDWLIED